MLLICGTYGSCPGFDFQYYHLLLDDVKGIRARFPSDMLILGGDFNIEFFHPVGPEERLESLFIPTFGPFFQVALSGWCRDAWMRV